MNLPLRPVGVGADGARLVGSGIGNIGSQHSLSGNSLAIARWWLVRSATRVSKANRAKRWAPTRDMTRARSRSLDLCYSSVFYHDPAIVNSYIHKPRLRLSSKPDTTSNQISKIFRSFINLNSQISSISIFNVERSRRLDFIHLHVRVLDRTVGNPIFTHPYHYSIYYQTD